MIYIRQKTSACSPGLLVIKVPNPFPLLEILSYSKSFNILIRKYTSYELIPLEIDNMMLESPTSVCLLHFEYH